MTPRHPRRRRPPSRSALVVAAAAIVGIVTAGSAAASTVPGPVADPTGFVAGQAISPERCAANEAAGPITFLSGYRYAASAGMIDMMVAEARGYYDELCLDVEFVPSFSLDNYALVAEGEAQFASAGSVSEMVNFSEPTDADLVALMVRGNFPIETLIAKPGVASTPGDFAGTTIGVKAKLPAAVQVMLADAGLVEGTDYDTVLLDGFDPLVHYAIDEIDGFPGHRSNEPGALGRAELEFDQFDPADFAVPGTMGVTYAARSFVDAHPTVATDFARATLRGLADAVADPEAAVAIAAERAAADRDPTFDVTTERFRWTTEAGLIVADAEGTTTFGVPDATAVQGELDAYAAVDYFTTAPPAADTVVVAQPTSELYDADGQLAWVD